MIFLAKIINVYLNCRYRFVWYSDYFILVELLLISIYQIDSSTEINYIYKVVYFLTVFLKIIFYLINFFIF